MTYDEKRTAYRCAALTGLLINQSPINVNDAPLGTENFAVKVCVVADAVLAEAERRDREELKK